MNPKSLLLEEISEIKEGIKDTKSRIFSIGDRLNQLDTEIQRISKSNSPDRQFALEGVYEEIEELETIKKRLEREVIDDEETLNDVMLDLKNF